MSRSALTDHLQNFAFWILDVSPIGNTGLPVFTPVLGFSSITAPEITVETTEIQEGNWYFSTAVLKSAAVGNITLTRGATAFDSDFYNWIRVTLAGDPDAAAVNRRSFGGLNVPSPGVLGSNFPLTGRESQVAQRAQAAAGAAFDLGVSNTALEAGPLGGRTYRRDLLLVQFFARGPLNGVAASAVGTSLEEVSVLLSGGAVAGATAVGAASSIAGTEAGLPGLINSSDPGSTGLFLPPGGRTQPFFRLPAKAWILRGCIPVRYKAGTDFDASSSDVSIQELELAVDIMDELNLSE
jgi:hypothetical protein